MRATSKHLKKTTTVSPRLVLETHKAIVELVNFTGISRSDVERQLNDPKSAKKKTLVSLMAEAMSQKRIHWRDAILTHLSGFEEKRTVLSYQGGVGTEALYLFEAGYETMYFDINPEATSFARSRFALYSAEIVQLEKIMQAGQVDAIVSSEVPANKSEWETLCGQLNHGGLLYIPCVDQATERRLVKAGFTIIEKLADGSLMVLGKYGVVDIIVPTYNAYDYVVECIESVRQYTTDTPYRLVLIDDTSPDKNIGKYYKKIAEAQDVFLTNKKNLGFVKTVNRGLQVSGVNDVVLLNTDTVVSEGWLSRIQRAIYRSHRFATANPVSNNASIYSVQELAAVDSKLLSRAGKAIASTSQRLYPEIPVAVGFCLYIKRAALDRVGLLDEIFGRGYGEEGDFCMRCVKEGMSHVLVDDAFVYHKGSISMLAAGIIEEGTITVPENEKILLSRYPDYMQRVKDFIETGIMDRIRASARLGFVAEASNARQKLMFVIHNDIQGSSIGGTEFHLRDLVNGLKGKYACYVVHIEGGRALMVDEYVDSLVVRYAFELPGLKEYTVRNDYLFDLYGRLLDLFDIDLVHVHHLIRNSFDIVFAAKARNIPIVMTVHDYYLISPDYNLLYKYGMKKIAPELVDSYHENLFGLKNFTLANWQAMAGRLLAPVDLFIFPSETAKSELLERFNRLRVDRTLILPHGETLFADEDATRSIVPASKDKFSVVFLGYIHGEQKGGRMLRQMIPRLLAEGIEVHMLGSSEKDWLAFPQKNKLIFYGQYKRNNLVAMLEAIKPNAVALPSPWPETYSYTLSEAFIANIPAVCFDVGAAAERVRALGKGGIIVPEIGAKPFADAIISLARSPKKYNQLKKEATEISIKSLAENVAEYDGLYQQLFRPERAKATTVPLLELRRAAYGNIETLAELAKAKKTLGELHVVLTTLNRVRRVLPLPILRRLKRIVARTVR